MDSDGSKINLAINVGALGQKKSISGNSALRVRFDSDSSNNSGFLTPTIEKSLVGSSTGNGSPAQDAQGDTSKGWGGAVRRFTAANLFANSSSSREREGGGRFSMWGEQLHDKLFAKKDMKEVMRNKLKFNLRDENNDNPQSCHTDINSIIDYDEEDRQHIVKNNFVSDFIESTAFRGFILATIVLNSVFIALQTEKEMEQKYGYLFSALDQFILTIFICEVLLKWYGGFFTYWKVGWNIFDFVIVASSLIGPSLTFISNSRILRILRVLRAFRSLRSISALRPLQLVVQTIIQSLPDMANIILLLVIFMFVFAVIGVSLFAADSPQYFGNLETAMFTLFICITLDGWVEIFNTLRNDQFPLASIYFVIFILIGAFILINLVVAVVVTNLESAIAEQDELDMQQMQEEKGNQDDHKELATYDLRDAIHKKFWKHQKPIEVPNLPALNPLKVQNYIILVTAFEDNYAELVFLKEELLKISKEVWEWNSVVDEEEETAVPSTEQVQTTKAKKVIEEQGRKNEAPEKKERFSTLAHLLSRASIMAGESEPPKSSRRIKRKSTLSQSPGYTPLNPVLELDDSDSEDNEVQNILNKARSREGMRGKGKEKVKKHAGVGHHAPDQIIPAVEVNTDAEDTDESDDDKEEEKVLPVSSAYADMSTKDSKPVISSLSIRKDSKSQRTEALRQRRQSLMEELDRRDKKGDVLSDLITMNKKTNNFSGKSQNMSEFVRGVDWLRSKVKGNSDGMEKKKKWQVEADRERRGSGIHNPGVRNSLTSENLIQQHLSYIAASSKSDLNLEEEEKEKDEFLRRTSTMRDIEESLSSTVRETGEQGEGATEIEDDVVTEELEEDHKLPDHTADDTSHDEM